MASFDSLVTKPKLSSQLAVNFFRAQKWYQNGSKSNRLEDTAVLQFELKQPSFFGTA